MNKVQRHVLAVGFSQTGQLSAILERVLAPLRAHAGIHVDTIELAPREPYPFPWPFWRFFNTFPETVHEDVPPIRDLPIATDADYDLVILAYQVWFLSPSQPMTAFLQSPEAVRLLAGKPVVTLIGCRNMWVMAQERMKAQIERLGGHLVDNIVLTDDAHSAFTFFSTPMWMLTGRQGPWLGGRIPKAGVPAHEIAAAERFGQAIAEQLPERTPEDTSPMLEGLGAVRVNERLIGSEKVAKRSFRLWGRLLRALGEPESLPRRIILVLYVIFLVIMILTIVPLVAMLKTLLAPLMRERVAHEKAYFAAPSGESRHKLDGGENEASPTGLVTDRTPL